jgi:murein DD-endopeptidase MepM/ murein hydrolase activator NlpD
MSRPRYNLMILREGEVDEAVRSYSLPGYLPRLAILLGVIAVALVTTALFLLIFFWSAAREARALRAENESLRRSVAHVAELEAELERHREFTRRVADMIGLEIPALPDSTTLAAGTAESADESDFAGEMVPATGEPAPRITGVMVADCRPDPNNRPRGLPVHGRISRGFHPSAENPGLRHAGIDIAAHEGSPVFAPASGVVVYAGEDDVFGLMITIDHGGGFKTIYGHNSELKARIGTKVRRGEVIALSGNTGLSTAPHLHYEIQRGNEPIDPLAFLGQPNTDR